MNIYSAKDLGALVRSERKHCGWNQRQLASRADVSPLWISQLERGKHTAQFGLILRTLKELGLDLSVGKDNDAAARVAEPQVIDLDAIISSCTRKPTDQ